MSERHDTTPGIQPVGASSADQPAAGPPPVEGPTTRAYSTQGPGAYGAGAQGPPTQAYGTPAYGTPGSGAPGDSYYTSPQYTNQPVARRRPDVVAGLLLLLAGGAAALSLVTDWLTGENVNGLDLLRDAFSSFGDGVGELFNSGLWQPLLIVFGGGVLAVLGLLCLVPARTHRAIGVIALIVTLIVTASVLVPLARAGWAFSQFDVGFWFAIAVAVLGLLGSLKALVTGRKYETAPTTI
jgi:hypothetical protein